MTTPSEEHPLPPSLGAIDQSFLRQLDGLRLWARALARGALRGDHRSKARGAGIEYADLRDYVPGDDWRSLDWNIFARSEKLRVRLFEEDRDLGVCLALDTSTSMCLDGYRKLRVAIQLALALGAVALGQQDRVQLTTLASRLTPRTGELRGKSAVASLVRALRTLTAGGDTHLSDCLRALSLQQKRPGIVVILSDFYDPQPIEGGLDMLLQAHCQVRVIQITDPAESAPNCTGNLLLLDGETGLEQRATLTPKLLAAYKDEHQRFCQQLEQTCRERSIP